MKNLLWPNLYHFYTAALQGRENSDAMKMTNFILARLTDVKSEVSRGKLTTTELCSWSHWRTMRAEDPSGRRIQFAFDALVQSAWIAPIHGSGARPSRYLINPGIGQRFQERAEIAVSERLKYAALLPEKMPSKRKAD